MTQPPSQTPDADFDRRLMTELDAGNQAALAELYDRHGPQMFALGLRILHHRGDVEDLLHDVFLEAWQYAKAYDPARGTVRTWLLLKMRSRAIDRLRALATARKHAILGVTDELETVTSSNDTVRTSEQTLAHRALQSLPDGQRIVIELSYFQGLTCQEIATRCGIPLGTAKSRMSTGISKLRHHFGEA